VLAIYPARDWRPRGPTRAASQRVRPAGRL